MTKKRNERELHKSLIKAIKTLKISYMYWDCEIWRDAVLLVNVLGTLRG